MGRQPDSPARQLWTIGHWNSPEADFLRPLHTHTIEAIADVRSLPGSRRSPQFNQEAMREWLPAAGIDYVHLPELGGRRGRQPTEPALSAGWREPSFRNYAAYTLTDDFEKGLAELTRLASEQRVAMMCGEPVPWRCHRLLIANTLVARGWSVWHLIGDAEAQPHALGRWGATPVAMDDGRVSYPAEG